MDCPQCGKPYAPLARFCSGCGAPPPGGEPANRPGPAPAGASRPAPSFGMIAAVMIGGVLLLGLIAAVSSSLLTSSIQRGKEKQTLADMRTLSEALSRYRIERNHYPAGKDIGWICSQLKPNYLKECPNLDAWTTPEHPREFAYASWGTPQGCVARSENSQCGPQEYGLASAGRDGLFEQELFTDYERAETDNFDRDIVIRNGEQILTPTGKNVARAVAGHAGMPKAPPASSPLYASASPEPPDTAPVAHFPSPGEDLPAGPPTPAELRAKTAGRLEQLQFALQNFHADRHDLPSSTAVQSLCARLKPDFAPYCDDQDAWGKPIRYETWKVSAREGYRKGIEAYALISAGPDGKFELDGVGGYLRATSPPGDDLAVFGGYDLDNASQDPPRSALIPPEAPLSMRTK